MMLEPEEQDGAGFSALAAPIFAGEGLAGAHIDALPAEVVASIYARLSVYADREQDARRGPQADLMISGARDSGKFTESQMAALRGAFLDWLTDQEMIWGAGPTPPPEKFKDHPAFAWLTERMKTHARVRQDQSQMAEESRKELNERLQAVGVPDMAAFFDRFPVKGGSSTGALLPGIAKRAPHPAPSPRPFGLDGHGYFASNAIGFGAAKALFKAGDGWKINEDGVPTYVFTFGGNQDASIYGKVLFGILQPFNSDAETVRAADAELANSILERFGANTATLHLMLSAYAADGDGTFTVSRQEVYRALGIHPSQTGKGGEVNRKNLTTAERDAMAFREIENIQRLGFSVLRIGASARKSKKGPLFDFTRSEPAHMWHVTTEHFGQARLVQPDGQVVTTHEDWQLKGSGGLWKQLFLHGEPSLRQLGILNRAEFDKWATRSRYARALWIRLQYQVRFTAGKPVTLTNKDIIEFAGGNTQAQGDERRNLKEQLKSARTELEADGWGISEPRQGRDADQADEIGDGSNAVPPGPRRESWPDFLSAKTIFTPPAAVTAKLLLTSERAEQRKALPAGSKAKPAPSSEWYASRVQGLIQRLGVSQAAFARMVGVQSPMVTYWRSGQRAVSPTMAKKLDAIERELTEAH